ncbi:MAG: transcriptional repressor [Chloroflexota bacterium]|nr:transcriptional repressor [Chloroflexota bacterium]
MTISDARAVLQRSGYRLTPARTSVLSALSRREGSFTAAEVLHDLEASAPEVGRATLFRTLDLLISLGTLERVRLPGGLDGYVLCGPPHHHHIVCTACGVVGEVPGEALEAALSAAVEATGFALEHHALELSGTCRACLGPAAGGGP